MRARTRESRRRRRRMEREPRSQQMFRSQLFETLEDRRLLTTVGMTTLEQLQQQEIQDAFEKVSNLEQYPSGVLSETRNWVVQVNPGTDINALEEMLNVDTLRPSGLISNTYIFTLPEAVMPSAPLTSSTDDGSQTDNSASDDSDGLDEPGEWFEPDADLNDGPVIETTSTVDSASQNSLVIDGVEYGFPVDPVSVLSNASGVRHFYPLPPREAALMFRPNDEFFPDQWHLYNDGANSLGGTPGEDIRAEAVWSEPFNITGNGITVGVVDSGVQMDHPDLVRNLEPTISCDFIVAASNTGTILCDMTNPDDLDNHGTSVAGIIGAEADNSETGVAGIAFNSKLAAMKIGECVTGVCIGFTDEIISEAFSRFSDEIDIYNNSWGFTGVEWLSQPGPLSLAALQQTTSGSNAGRGGLGSIYVFAAGNEYDTIWDPGPTDGTPDWRSDYAGFQSSRYTINVAAAGHTGEKADYSLVGSSLFVSGYGHGVAEDGGDYGITTTAIGSTYPSDFGGTSAAAPMVSGVIALILEANSSLSWRDVQHVIVNSARQTDLLNPSWITNGGGHQFSEQYGFGVIDALASVVTAQGWENVGTEIAISQQAEIENPIPIPDNGGNASSAINIGQCLNTESVEIILSAPHEDWSDLTIKLISPSGTEAVFAEKHDGVWDPFIQDEPEYVNWRVSTPIFWDECSSGDWTLVIEDEELHNEGTLNDWQLNIYGTEIVLPPEPPPEASEGDISGHKWQDDNSDGLLNGEEKMLAGVIIYADIDNDGRIDLGEPQDVTDAHGRYSLKGLPTGDYSIREVMSPGWHQVFPGGEGRHQVSLTADGPVTGVNFGNQYGFDFGDAPNSYGTLVASNGASHGLIEGFHLGAKVDSELDGYPGESATGDDLNANGDDEDGIFFNQMFADTTASLGVEVSFGTASPGVLQGWIDFNIDGDWNDSGEQIFTDHAVSEGYNNLTFNVPASAVASLPTYARFRLGYERGIGPTGAAFAGEVEDYQVLVMDDDPVAVDDCFEVPQNSLPFPMDVLGNNTQGCPNLSSGADLPGIVGGLEIIATSSPSHSGTVQILDLQGQVVLPGEPGGVSLIYTPAFNFFSPPNETFTYTIEDDNGVQDTATVTVTIPPQFPDPIAVDDSYVIEGGDPSPNNLLVLTNDIRGENGDITVDDKTDPVYGTVVISNDGTYVTYTPPGNHFNMDSFTYTIINDAGETSTANVTIHMEEEDNPTINDNDVEFGVTFLNAAGTVLGFGNEVVVGDQFQVLVTVEDLRDTPEGAFSAYMDLLYDRQHVSVVAADALDCVPFGFESGICFEGQYDSLLQGNGLTPGLIDEVGALRPIILPPSEPFLTDGVTPNPDHPANWPTAMELYVVTFVANTVGTAEFKTDPGDNPVLDTTLYGLLNEVDPPEITYKYGEVNIVASGSGEGESLDTNGDGAVTPLDALNVINDLNQNGSRAVADGGEGETAAADARLDVNRDQFISPADALMLINYLNGVAEEAAQTADAPLGEGEGAVPIMGPQPATQSGADDDKSTVAAGLEADLFAEAILPTVDPARNQQTLSESATSMTRQDRVFAKLHDDAAGEADSLLDDLATDVCQAWLS